MSSHGADILRSRSPGFDVFPGKENSVIQITNGTGHLDKHCLMQWLKTEVKDVLLTIEHKLDQLADQLHQESEVHHKLAQQHAPPHPSMPLGHVFGQIAEQAHRYRLPTQIPKVSKRAESDPPPSCPLSTDLPQDNAWEFSSSTSKESVQDELCLAHVSGTTCCDGEPEHNRHQHTVNFARSPHFARKQSVSVASRLTALRLQENAPNIQSLHHMRQRSKTKMLVWEFLEEPDLVIGGKVFAFTMTIAIISSVLLTLVQTFEEASVTGIVPNALEVMFDSAFSIEILVRFWVCPSKIAFFLRFQNLLDIVTGIVVLFLRVASGISRPDFWQSSVQWIVLLCVVPILRLLKLLRRFEQFHLLSQAFKHAFEALPVLLYTLCIIVLTAAVMIYLVEAEENIPSLPDAIWFTIVTATTVGYGDMVPKSNWGKLVVSILTITSALYMAMPIGIVGSAFSQVWADRDRLVLMHHTSAQLRQAGYTAKDVPQLFRLFDSDEDGALNFKEFRRMIHEMHVGLSDVRIAELFQAFDSDASGLIDEGEFVRLLFPSTFTESFVFLPASSTSFPPCNE